MIYRNRYLAFLRVAVAITGDEQLGADAVQDAFVGVVRSRRGIRWRGAPESLAWRAVVNAARDRSAVRAEAGEPPELAASVLAGRPGSARDRAAAGASATRALPPLLRRPRLRGDRARHARSAGDGRAALNAARAAVKESLEREEAVWRP